ncbi:glycosyltransferase family 4 protein, partial [Bacteroidota bacterium]
AIIHDINFHHRPEDLPFLTRKYYQNYFPKFAQKAIRIGTVSNYSKNDIAKSYHINPDNIDVLYNGANCFYKPIRENEKRKVKRNFTDGYNYFVFVGSLHPRKNVTRLLQAFELFKSETNSEMKLVIVGDRFFKTREMSETYKKMKYKDEVIFTGRQSPNNLRLLIGGATALTFVPTFEGFGIPNLEAMYCDIPVITSNVTAIPEVVHDAGILVDPFWVAEIKDAMVRISTDFEFRNKLIEKGQKRRALYSWDNTAENLWKCIEKCI